MVSLPRKIKWATCAYQPYNARAGMRVPLIKSCQLPSDLQARVEEGLAVELDDTLGRLSYPDVRVVEDRPKPYSLESPSQSVSIAEPFEIPLPIDAPPERHIEIIDAGSGNRVVTAIELLSSANKLGEAGRERYRAKQTEYIHGGVNVVEIDLLRTVKFVLAMPEQLWPAQHQATYRLCIRRVCTPDTAAGIGVRLRERLPNIPEQ